MKISTEQAIKLLQRSDCIVLEGNDLRTTATFVGFAEESDPDSHFILGAEGWDDIIIEDPEWDLATATMSVHDFTGSIKLYEKLRPQ